MNHKQILTKLLQPYLMHSPTFAPDYSKKQERFSAVAIILRNLSPTTQKTRQIDMLLNTQILLLERIENGKAYSGQVCLPGGKCEEGQTIYQTAVRQSEQQTGLKLAEKDLVGVLNQKFTAFRRPTLTLFIHAAVFYLFQSQHIVLNRDEMQDHRWLPIRYFMNDQVFTPIIVPVESFPPQSGFGQFKGIKHFEWPAIDVGLKKNLYGLTLYMLDFFMSRLEGSLNQIIQKLVERESALVDSPQKRQKVRVLKEQFKNIQRYERQVRQLYFKSFEDLNVTWREDCTLTSQQKQSAKQALNAFVKHSYPQRPKF